MDFYFYYYGVVIFILGTVFGSFFNVVIYRIPAGMSLIKPGSHCPNCKRELGVMDLIPILSFILLNGRCRGCKKKISTRYPMVELVTGLAFLIFYIKYGLTINLFKYLVLFSYLLVVGAIDYDSGDVYFSTSLFGLIAGVVFVIIGLFFKGVMATYLLGGAFGYGLIYIIYKLTSGMGLGDAEICGVCGLFLGFKLTLVGMFLSFIIGAVYGVYLLISKKAKLSEAIPFGPFIAIAFIITMYWGQSILNWYLTFLN